MADNKKQIATLAKAFNAYVDAGARIDDFYCCAKASKLKEPSPLAHAAIEQISNILGRRIDPLNRTQEEIDAAYVVQAAIDAGKLL